MLSFGLKVTALGFGTVFVGLIILMVSIMVQTKIFEKKSDTQQAKPAAAAPAPVAAAPVVETNDDELVAVIAAAVAAAGGSVYVKAITRVQGTTGAPWAAGGRTNFMNSNL